MKYHKIIVYFLLFSTYVGATNIFFSNSSYKDGDLIFQTELLPRGMAIQAATASRYNHVGIIFKENGKYYVYEAIGTVTKTPLDSFVNRRGTFGRYTVMRPNKNNIDVNALKNYIRAQIGKRYDPQLKWTDSKMYCSELVWKAYHNSNSLKISTPKSIEDRIIGKVLLPVIPPKYIKNLDINDLVVSPADLARSWKLHLVYTNY